MDTSAPSSAGDEFDSRERPAFFLGGYVQYIITYNIPTDSIIIFEVGDDFELDPADKEYILLETTREL